MLPVLILSVGTVEKKIEKEKRVLIYLIDHIKELACVLVGSVDYDV